MGLAGFEYGFPIGYEASQAASKLKATSYSNFFYSNHVGVMQWAHNISAAALSHQVSDLRMAQGVYLQHTLTSISVWYFPMSSCHHDTSIGLLHFVALFPKHISASCVEQDCRSSKHPEPSTVSFQIHLWHRWSALARMKAPSSAKRQDCMVYRPSTDGVKYAR